MYKIMTERKDICKHSSEQLQEYLILTLIIPQNSAE
jgi:hypothetical protein